MSYYQMVFLSHFLGCFIPCIILMIFVYSLYLLLRHHLIKMIDVCVQKEVKKQMQEKKQVNDGIKEEIRKYQDGMSEELNLDELLDEVNRTSEMHKME